MMNKAVFGIKHECHITKSYEQALVDLDFTALENGWHTHEAISLVIVIWGLC